MYVHTRGKCVSNLLICATYMNTNDCNCERASGIEPIKLLFDRSLQGKEKRELLSISSCCWKL
jgi:hypothetical protein